jgi:hypothetical protein
VLLGFGVPDDHKIDGAVGRLAAALANQPACEALSAD